MFAESPVDWSGKEADEVKRLMKKTTAQPHQVAALFKLIIGIVKDQALIPDEVFQPETWPFQANWDQWGRGYQGGNRGNASGANPKAAPDVIVLPVATRDDAVASLIADRRARRSTAVGRAGQPLALRTLLEDLSTSSRR